MEEKTDIKELGLEDLQEALKNIGQPAYRGKQIHEWLWKRKAGTFLEMTNLPKELIAQLEKLYFIPVLSVGRVQKSTDGTIKSGFVLHDNLLVEGVLIPQGSRMTACISSQVGCSLTCTFCATGKMKQVRNLRAGEIYDQVKTINRQALENYGHHLSNVVYMGMGEPLLNYREVMRSIDMLVSKNGMGMSPRRITLSTAGVAKMIRRMGDDEVKFNLALSLHAANDEKRNEIMPINEQNDLESLSSALRYFQDKTGNRLTVEYIVFKDFNDEVEDAMQLAEFCRKVACKINIIEYNPIDEARFQNADRAKIDPFVKYLESRKLIVNVRRSRGKDIDAACGQLANKGGGEL